MKRIIYFISCVLICFHTWSQVTITMEKKGDVYYVPGEINGLPLNFIYDTGASNVYISLTEALFMLKNGYLNEKDFGKTSYSQIANGDIVENTEVNLKEVKVGPVTINNVKAMVSNTISAPLLLGQSAIQKLGPIQLDGNKLIISSGKDLPSNETAYKLYQQAYQASEAGNYDESIALSMEALKFSTEPYLRAYLYDNIAYALKNKGQNKEAIEVLNKALGEDIMAEQPGYNLGVYLYDEGKYEEALKALNNYIQRHSNTQIKEYLSGAYAYKGDSHIKLGQIKDGEEAYYKSIAIEPSSQAYLGLADLYATSNKFQEATKYYEYALEYEPYRLSNIKRWHQLGFCYARLGQNKKAIEAFENCQQAMSANKELLSYAIASGNPDLALDAIEFSQLGFNAQLWLARLSDNAEDAIYNFEKAIILPEIENDFIVEDFLRWVMAYQYAGNPTTKNTKSKEIINKGLEKFPDNPDLLFSYILMMDDNDLKRLEYMNKILDQEFSYKPLSFDYSTVYNNIAWTLFLNNKSEEALPYSETAIKKDSSHDYNWETLGQIYFSLGRYQDCIDAMSKCIDLSGDKYKSAYELRGKSYRALGKKKEATQDENKVKTLK